MSHINHTPKEKQITGYTGSSKGEEGKEGRYVGDIIAIPTGGTTPGWFTFYLLISTIMQHRNRPGRHKF